MKAGMRMASVVPSTMGTLMASGIMEAGKALKGKKNEMGPADLSVYFYCVLRPVSRSAENAAGGSERSGCGRRSRDRASACTKQPGRWAGAGNGRGGVRSGGGRRSQPRHDAQIRESRGVCRESYRYTGPGATAGMYMLKGMARYIR